MPYLTSASNSNLSILHEEIYLFCLEFILSEPTGRGWKSPESTQGEAALPELQETLTMVLVDIGNNSGVEINH
jgi:hypothetical protein